jgi:hypothetical protein
VIDHRLECVRECPFLAARLGDEHGVIVRLRDAECAAEEIRCLARQCDPVGDEADGARPSAPQREGGGIRAVVQFGGGAAHAIGGVCRESRPRTIVEDHAHGGLRDARALGDIGQRRAAARVR